MGHQIKILAAAISAAALAAAGHAQAGTLLQATFTGQMGTGTYDFDGVFGHGGAFNSLDGLDFTIVALYDPTLGNVVKLGPTSEGRRGGEIFGVANPVKDVQITIDGHQVGFTPDLRSQLQSNFHTSFQLNFQERVPSGPYFDSFSLTANYPASGDLDATLPPTVVSGAAQLDLFNATALRGHMSFVLKTAQISTYVLPVAVPEPSTWALMIGGFGLAGAGLRRRRSALAA